MITAQNISRNFFKNKNYEVMIIDVNSLFLFGGKNSLKGMYSFIETTKRAIGNNNLLVINVIDNGINQRILKKYPYYKANRIHSIQSNNIYSNKFTSQRAFKYKITRIHKIDNEFNNHLTFYLPGESDFKVGWLLKFFQERTPIEPSEILTVSFDKDYLLCTTLSDVLLRRVQDNKRYWCLLDKDTDINKFKDALNISQLNIRNIFEYFYFLIINGDDIDNIKQLLTKGNSIKLINHVIDKYNKLNLELLSNHIKDFNNALNGNDIYENCYLVDLFNSDVWTTNQKNTMIYTLGSFLTTNNVRVFE